MGSGGGALWHKVDIRDNHSHKIINFCNDFVGLTIADDLICKIWIVYGNVFLLHLLGCKIQPLRKSMKIFYLKPRHVTHKIFCYDPRKSNLKLIKCIIQNIGNTAKNVILGAINTPNLPLKLMSIFCFWSYRPAKYVKLTEILLCIKFQLWTIFFFNQNNVKNWFLYLRGNFWGEEWGKNCPQPPNERFLCK